jgi:hypothetical protein
MSAEHQHVLSPTQCVHPSVSTDFQSINTQKRNINFKPFQGCRTHECGKEQLVLCSHWFCVHVFNQSQIENIFLKKKKSVGPVAGAQASEIRKIMAEVSLGKS